MMTVFAWITVQRVANVGPPGNYLSAAYHRARLCQAPGVIGSALGLVGPVSVYCNWVR